MPAISLGLEPEIDELLREIATDERSTLLRVPPKKLPRFAAVGGRADLTGLTKAERHLMQTHRVEVAEALRRVCRDKLWAHPESRFHALKAPKPQAQLVGGPTKPVARQLLQGIAEMKGDKPLPIAARFLAASAPEKERSMGASVTELAAASLRLEPTGQARIYCAIEELYEGRSPAALVVLRSVLSGQPCRRIRGSALSNTGWGLAQLGKTANALAAFSEAASAESSSSKPVMSMVIQAVFLRDMVAMQHSMALLNDRVLPWEPVVTSFVEQQQQHRLCGRMKPDQSVRAFARQLLGKPSGAARRLIEVLT